MVNCLRNSVIKGYCPCRATYWNELTVLLGSIKLMIWSWPWVRLMFD